MYDYFEPLLRKEQFGSRAHDLYALTRSALSRLAADSIESKMVKTIALIHLVAQFNQLPPTKEVVAGVLADSGIDYHSLDAAIDNLLDTDSVVYLKRSDSRLKLKETSGVPIQAQPREENHAILRLLFHGCAGRCGPPVRWR